MKAIIFDFNGTLFWDSHFHEISWNKIAGKVRGEKLTYDEIRQEVHGRSNRSIIAYILGHEPGEDEYEQIAEEKEQIYQEICIQNPEEFNLAPGAVELLDDLVSKDISMAIATMAGKGNVDFYMQNLNLHQWFQEGQIVYDDGTFPGKPAPDIYLKATEKSGYSPAQCIVFEDSVNGLKSAMNAGIGRVIAVNSNGQPDEYLKMDGVYRIISHFGQVGVKDITS